MPDCLNEFSWQEWEEATISEHVTIADILELEPDKPVSYICMDRNVWDIALADKEVEEKMYDPIKFFRDNIVEFTKSDDEKILGGTLDIVDVGPLENFEVHIEYSPGNWFPLYRGHLPERDPQGFAKFPWNLDARQPKRLHWRDYPVSTHVGYRGPWVKISSNLPKIIY
jgi:hypothetical protein